MQVSKYFAILVVAFLSLYGVGCNDNGDGTDPDEACESFCERAEECDISGFALIICEDLCDDLGSLDDEIDGDCEDELVDLFECAEDASCEDLEDLLDLTEVMIKDEFLEELLSGLEDVCSEEIADAEVECGFDKELDP